MKKNNGTIIGIIICAVGVAYGLYSQSKMNRIANRLNMSINDLDKNMAVDIPQNMIDSAMKQAIDRKVAVISHEAALAASLEITATIRKEVKQEVGNKFNDLSQQVADEISGQVAKIDQSALAERISRKAEQKILDKFDGSLDDVLENFNRELRNVNKIHSSIADALLANNRNDDQKSIFLKLS